MIWILFLLLILILLILDLVVLHRKAVDLSVYEAFALVIFWVSLGLSFGILIYFTYENHWFSNSINPSINGKTALIEYFTAYLVEESLSLDNLFVIALILQSLQIPLGYQHRVLLWGILGAIILRGASIWLGVYLYDTFSWMNYVFGLVLLFSAAKLLMDDRQPAVHSGQNAMIRMLQRFLPLVPDMSSGRFFVRQSGTLCMTPLFIAVLMVETADLLFAMDSIPAVIGISQDKFIIFSSNIFAILGLRALYFVLAAALASLRYLKVTLILILSFIGVKMLLANHIIINSGASLLIIVILLALGIGMSLLFPHQSILDISPVGKARLNTLYHFTYASLRRAFILIVGSSVVLVGIIMLFTPGPAILVIPAGIAILATEFFWARRLLNRIKEKFAVFRNRHSGVNSGNEQSKD